MEVIMINTEKAKHYVEYNFHLLEKNKKLDWFLLIFGAIYSSVFIAITGYFYLSFVGF